MSQSSKHTAIINRHNTTPSNSSSNCRRYSLLVHMFEWPRNGSSWNERHCWMTATCFLWLLHFVRKKNRNSTLVAAALLSSGNLTRWHRIVLSSAEPLIFLLLGSQLWTKATPSVRRRWNENIHLEIAANNKLGLSHGWESSDEEEEEGWKAFGSWACKSSEIQFNKLVNSEATKSGLSAAVTAGHEECADMWVYKCDLRVETRSKK